MPILGLAPSSEPIKPAHFDIEKVIRPNILALHPYRCARDDYQEGILLDANENALGHSIPPTANDIHPELQSTLDLNLNRYPDPSHDEIKSRIASLRSLPGKDHVFLGVGSDEVIDLIMRVCVSPAREKILITPPTYGMYAVCAQVNDVDIVRCNLNLSGAEGEGGANGRFSVQVDDIKEVVASDPSIKLIFLCSPGNPTGTLISHASLRSLLEYEPFKGIIIVDEAYIDFAGADASTASLVKDYANLCVMQTLSKSFGLAAIRLGVALAQPPLIQVLTNTKAPYNISTPTAQLGLAALADEAISGMRQKVATLVSSRGNLLQSLKALSPLGVGAAIGGNDANFVVVPILNRDTREPDNVRSERVYKALAEENKVVIRFRGKEAGCAGCVRITVGTDEENETLMRELEKVLTEI
ncbi:histidinol-phosphate aminotransferase [Leucogyrophana mollusca]|uniref:Histidinol-phosphate aminotransferase n=1 Tax=Leucogyrophana mollusca TaxID=85980 RepID=A0ACB8BBT9_9AGAM|nr:histidinol-phosphate aminotransferase [Leucogyrophana mollusca]